AICADPQVMDWLGGVLPPHEADARLARVEETFDRLGYGRFCLERRSDGRVLGWCGVMPAHESQPVAGTPEIGWRLIPETWGQGYATEAAAAVLADAFGRLGMAEVWAYTSPHNVRSQAVMQRLGLARRPDLDFENPSAPTDDPFRPAWVWLATP
ncbi:MAG: GNAT family N-acetyltransferase, partial [Phenylobacterium sp.]|nr:GNAT family N-acetyltransferase [Phenylobacterium sp.]